MKKILTNWRYYVIFAITMTALCLLIADTNDDLPFAQQAYILLSTKLLSAAAFYLLFRLIKLWESRNRIPEMTEIPDKY